MAARPVESADKAPGHDPAATPGTLLWATGLLGAEAVGLLGVSGWLGYDAATSAAQSVASAAATVAFAVLMAVVLGGLAYALWRRRSWARGPSVVLQLLLLPIGYSVATAGQSVVGVALIVIGLAGVATLVAPATRAALERR
jgi:hypothetical protein